MVTTITFYNDRKTDRLTKK